MRLTVADEPGSLPVFGFVQGLCGSDGRHLLLESDAHGLPQNPCSTPIAGMVWAQDTLLSYELNGQVGMFNRSQRDARLTRRASHPFKSFRMLSALART